MCREWGGSGGGRGGGGRGGEGRRKLSGLLSKEVGGSVLVLEMWYATEEEGGELVMMRGPWK